MMLTNDHGGRPLPGRSTARGRSRSPLSGRIVTTVVAAAAVGVGSFVVLPTASASVEPAAVITWKADENTDLTGFGQNGGTVAFTFVPEYTSGSPEAVAQCGYDPDQIKPFTWTFTISDQTPTDAYAGTPDLVYTRWDKGVELGRAFHYGTILNGRRTPLSKNHGDFGGVDLSTVPTSPVVTESDGRLTTPDWALPSETGPGLLVTTQVHTITAGNVPAFPSYLSVDQGPQWDAHQNVSVVGTKAFGGVVGYNGVAGISAPRQSPGDAVSVQVAGATADGGNVNPSVTMSLVVRSATAAVICPEPMVVEPTTPPATDPTTEPTTPATEPTTDPTTGPTAEPMVAEPTTQPATQPKTTQPKTTQPKATPVKRPAAVTPAQQVEAPGVVVASSPVAAKTGGVASSPEKSLGPVAATGGRLLAAPPIWAPIVTAAAGLLVLAALGVLMARRRRG